MREEVPPFSFLFLVFGVCHLAEIVGEKEKKKKREEDTTVFCDGRRGPHLHHRHHRREGEGEGERETQLPNKIQFLFPSSSFLPGQHVCLSAPFLCRELSEIVYPCRIASVRRSRDVYFVSLRVL